MARLGGILAGIGQATTGQALVSAGLAHLVGQDRFVVLDELITYIAGSGDDLDSVAARDAACDVLDELFDNADSWDDLDRITIGRDQLGSVLEHFLAMYVYNRVPVVAERLSQLTDPVAMRKADQEMRELIASVVAVTMPTDPFAIDWAGPDGRRIAADAIRSAYDLLSALED